MISDHQERRFMTQSGHYRLAIEIQVYFNANSFSGLCWGKKCMAMVWRNWIAFVAILATVLSILGTLSVLQYDAILTRTGPAHQPGKGSGFRELPAVPGWRRGRTWPSPWIRRSARTYVGVGIFWGRCKTNPPERTTT